MLELSKQEDIEIENPILPFKPFIKVGIKDEIKKEYKSPFFSDKENKRPQNFYENSDQELESNYNNELNAEFKGRPDSTYNPFLQEHNEEENGFNHERKETFSNSFPPSSTEASTPSTQKSIPPPTVQPTYIVTTTTENPSPTRRVHSIRRFIIIFEIKCLVETLLRK